MKRFVIRIDCKPASATAAGPACFVEIRILDADTRAELSVPRSVPIAVGDGAEIVTECCPAESAEEITRRFALELSGASGG